MNLFSRTTLLLIFTPLNFGASTVIELETAHMPSENVSHDTTEDSTFKIDTHIHSSTLQLIGNCQMSQPY